MLKSESIAKQICQQLNEWKKEHTKLIVGIDGYAGSGKTTIGDFIAKHDKDVIVIHLDDFIHHWKVRKEKIETAEDKSKVFEYEWYRYDELERLMRDFLEGKKSADITPYDYKKNDFAAPHTIDLSKSVLVIDGIFLIHPHHERNKLIDKKIYLDADFEKADKKRIAREKKNSGDKYLPDDHPDNWVRYFKEAYRRYVKEYAPQERADAVFRV